jgi:hypothetical protein
VVNLASGLPVRHRWSLNSTKRKVGVTSNESSSEVFKEVD